MFLFFQIAVVFTCLICNAAGGFACGLARSLAFAAAAVCSVCEIACLDCFDSLHNKTPKKIFYITSDKALLYFYNTITKKYICQGTNLQNL